MLKFLATATALLFMVVPASAGSTTLIKGNAKMALYCNGGGCYTAPYVNGKKGKAKRIGAGGAANFQKHRKAFKSQGWS